MIEFKVWCKLDTVCDNNSHHVETNFSTARPGSSSLSAWIICKFFNRL
jgi:hypothetical protein